MKEEAFVQTAAKLGLTLSPEQVAQFEAFEGALYQANEVMNLTRVSREECWLRHFSDSLLLSPLIPTEASVLDIGTGPGFPAWPLACARPDVTVTAIDSSGKMLGFLASQPLANLKVLKIRAEEANLRELYDVVTGRAVAPLAVQLELSAAPCKVGGILVPMRTPNDGDAIAAFLGRGLGIALERVERRLLPGTDIERVFPIYRKVARTESRLPRSWAEIRREPLK